MSGGHGAHADASDPFQKRAAVAIALFTVILAFANMLTNQSRTKAILSSNRATNQWSYYQSKSTKLLVMQLRLDGLPRDSAELARVEAEIARYEREKEEIKQRAEGLAVEEAAAEHKEHFFEYSATAVELGIVLAGIALLMSARKLLAAAAVFAAGSLVLMAYTAFLLGHAEVEQRPESAEAHAGAARSP